MLRPRHFGLFSTGAIWVFFAAAVVQADVKLPAVFGDHMVLQRDTAVPVWGWADPGETVTVTFREQSLTATADDDGRWSVKLSPLTVGDPATLAVTGRNALECGDILVGEVWVCSGQSNMQMAVQASFDADLEIAAANLPDIRLFKVPLVTAVEPQSDVAAHWERCSSESVPSVTAAGYFFGRQLQQTLGVPVGLIQTAWGGTRAEAWTSPSALATVPELAPILSTWQERCAAYDPVQAQQRYETALAAWKVTATAARQAGQPLPRRPEPPRDPRLDQQHPSNLFNAMVAPLSPFAIRGAIWYQGEANASRAYQYRTLLPTMIKSWRDDWSQGDFPFYIVQLANFRAVRPQPMESDWAELREAQMLSAAALPNVGVVCITDLGAAGDIHPKDKQHVGQRLARLALVHDYGRRDIVPQGPTFKSLEIQGDTCLVQWTTYGRPLISWYNEPLTGFAIAGEDQQWRWAEARITGPDTVEVRHPDIASPVAVRYNWADNPQGNLYNAAYLPAYPFRTDAWPGVTVDKVTP